VKALSLVQTHRVRRNLQLTGGFLDAVKRILYAREVVAEAELDDAVREIELVQIQRLQVVDVHAVLLEALSGRDVEVTGDLSLSSISSSLGEEKIDS
jgi:hypothetical protein